MALQDTIDGLLERQRVQSAPQIAKADLLTEWLKDVDDVMSAIEAVLAGYVATGKASVESRPAPVIEEAIGAYSARSLHISVAARDITVAPIARVTFMGTGRIDMFRANRPSEEDRLLVIRPSGASAGGTGAWLIETRGHSLSVGLGIAAPIRRGTRSFVTLDSASIEGALEYLLEVD